MKLSDLPLFLAGIFTMLTLVQCGTILYVPNGLNAPMLYEKGDYDINVGLVGNSPSVNFDLQGAYALTDHHAMMFNSSMMPNSSGPGYGQRHYMVEAAGGFFGAFLQSDRGWEMVRVDAFGGYGFGWAKDFSGRSISSGQYHRAFVQPSFGLRGKGLECSFAMRASVVNFSEVLTRAGGRATFTDGFGFSTIEPAVTLSLGYEGWKAYLQLGGVGVVSGKENYNLVADAYDRSTVNLGVSIDPFREKTDMSLDFWQPDFTSPLPDSVAAAPLPEKIFLDSTEVTVCFQVGNPKILGETYRLVFGGNFLDRDFRPNGVPQCFELKLGWNKYGSLRILPNVDRTKLRNSLWVSVQSGGDQNWYYLRPEKGAKTEVMFRLKK